MIDTYRHKGMRKELVNTLKSKGIKDKKVLSAINNIPRHWFLDSSFLEYAYQDKPFPIGAGQTISQPFTVARQTELLKVEKNMKVLEIGTGSGFQACVLGEMGTRVFTVERQKKLYLRTKKFLQNFPYRIKTFFDDGNKGLPAFAPFDRIIITAAAPEIPQNLIEQLKPNGMLLLPLGLGEVQQMVRITKLENGSLDTENFGNYRFVPMLKNKADD
jgi:protein-L-isoaspartate(D-aspartate) O-methyltransferase